MFRCGVCNNVSQPYEKAIRKVVKTRDKQYVNNGNVSYGTEIVVEVVVAACCK